MYDLSNVTRHYQKGGRAVTALHELNLAIGDGEWLAIQGRTGHGKTTLLHILGGLDRPTAGTVTFAGRDLGRLREAQATRIGEYHGLQEHHDALVTLLTDPRFPELADDVVIEFGNSRHQAAGQPPPGGVVSLIEQQTGQRAFSLIALTPLAGDPGGTFGRLAHYPTRIVIPAAGTWLGPVNSGDVLSPVIAPGPSGQPVNINCGVPLGSVIDGGLYLGQASDLTMSRPDPAIYLDQAYWAELQRRDILQGGVSDLNALRQEQSARFTPQAVPPSLLCS